MKKYSGKAAATYGQTNGKKGLLIPAIKRILPKTTNADARLLDIACGLGDFSSLIQDKGYEYFGLDISEDMIARARVKHPDGNYTVASSINFAHFYKKKFDIVLISMLFTDLPKKTDIQKTLSESKKVLKKNGLIVIGTAHPSFNRYMQAGVLGRKDDVVNFKSYFASGDKFFINVKIDGKPYRFEDHHWTLKDYIDCIKAVELSVVDLDECPPDETIKGLSKDFFEERNRFPTYLVLVCQ